MADPLNVDVAVVGGGIIGCAAAYWLSRRGVRVAVFERAGIASEQSSRAWGFIRQQGRNPAEVPLAAEAMELWSEFSNRAGGKAIELTRNGILVPAETEADEERIVSAQEAAAKYKLRAKILSGKEITRLMPELHGTWRCALYTPDDGHGEPGPSTHVLAKAATSEGAQVFVHEPVHAIRFEEGGTTCLQTTKRICSAGAILLAGGIGSGELARSIGLDLPIQIVRSSVLHTTPMPWFTSIGFWGPSVAFRPKADGSFYVGNGYRGAGADYDLTVGTFQHLRYFLPAYKRNWRLLRLSFGREFWVRLRSSLGQEVSALPEPRPNMRKIRSNLERFRSLFPHLGEVEVARSWAGRIDLTPDVIPIIDCPLPDNRCFIASGFSGHGFALGPSIGKQIAEWIIDGSPSINLRSFRLSRFAEGDFDTSSKAL